jgi:hypothetical protein
MTEIPTDAEKSAQPPIRVKRASSVPKPSKPKKRAKSNKAVANGKKGGRPVWQPSIDERTTVEQMKFCGESEAMIARALRVDVDTLRKHCPYELENGYANRRKEVTAWLFKAAKEGNVSAIKRLDEMGKLSRAAGALSERVNSPPGQAKPTKLGKKEEQQIAATQVGGKFTAPAPPKLVVDNR